MFESREMSSGVGKEARLHTPRAWNHVYFINWSTASVFGNLGARSPETEHRYTLHPGKKRETKRHFGLGIQMPTSQTTVRGGVLKQVSFWFYRDDLKMLILKQHFWLI